MPAAFNNLVGIKPTPGLLPKTGVVPACRSVDVVSVLAGSVAEGAAVRREMEGYDPADPFSRPAIPAALPHNLRIGVLLGPERELFGNAEVEMLYDAAFERASYLGGKILTFDFAPFREAAALLCDGPLVAVRLAAVGGFFATNEADFDPTARKIIGGAKGRTAVEAFSGLYRLNAITQRVGRVWDAVDVLLLCQPRPPPARWPTC